MAAYSSDNTCKCGEDRPEFYNIDGKTISAKEYDEKEELHGKQDRKRRIRKKRNNNKPD